VRRDPTLWGFEVESFSKALHVAKLFIHSLCPRPLRQLYVIPLVEGQLQSITYASLSIQPSNPDGHQGSSQ